MDFFAFKVNCVLFICHMIGEEDNLLIFYFVIVCDVS